MCNKVLAVFQSFVFIGVISRGAEALTDEQNAVARMNARFGNGRPSNKLNEAGVVVHGFDGKIPNAVDDGQGWFAGQSYWSASIINSRIPYMFLGHPDDERHSLHAGFVITPESAAASLSCSYDHDGITMALDECDEPADGERPTSKCVPGCVGIRSYAPTAPQTMRQWCSINTTAQTQPRATTDIPVDDFCAWPHNAIDAMMRQQEVRAKRSDWVGSCTGGPRLCAYNEIVLDPDTLRGMLPKAIEAIYFVTGQAALSPEHAMQGEKEAKAAQHHLLKTDRKSVV